MRIENPANYVASDTINSLEYYWAEFVSIKLFLLWNIFLDIFSYTPSSHTLPWNIRLW